MSVRRKKLPPGFDPRPAPGNLRVLQDFVNTRDIETGRDALESPQLLETWLIARELFTGGESVSEEEWREAMALREGLRQLIRSHNRGTMLEPSVVEDLNRVASRTDIVRRILFQPDGSTRRINVPTRGWKDTVARMLAWITEAEAAGRWSRLKSCHGETCQRIFYDGADNRSGKWCNPRRCGNREHTKIYRQRQPVWKRGP